MTDTVQDGTLRTRRSLLTAAAGGAAALAVSAIKPAGVAAAPANMQTETDNATIADRRDESTADSNALFGTGTAGIGVKGRSTDTTDPANDTRNAGVVGIAGDEGAIAENIALTGVYGYADRTPDPRSALAPASWAIGRTSASSVAGPSASRVSVASGCSGRPP